MIRRPPRSTLFPTRRSSDLRGVEELTEKKDCARVVDLYSRKVKHQAHLQLSRCERGRDCVNRLRNPILCEDRKSTRLNSSHSQISYAVFCLKKKKTTHTSICLVHSYLVPITTLLI